MEEIISIYKPVGITPFKLIQDLKKQDSRYDSLKIGYAGRLDPLAHGIMLLTIGEGNKKRDKYLNLNKSYDFTVLFGVETDSYDYLGFLSTPDIKQTPSNLKEEIQKFIKKSLGKFTQPYPPFSSKPVNGIPLYKLAKSGKIDPDNIPTKEVEIFDLKLISIETKSAEEIKKEIITNLKKIKGYFRQTKTIQKWQQLFKINPNHSFTLAHFSMECSSGTYVRSLANRMGKEFGTNAITLRICRTRIGDLKVTDCLRIY